MKTIIRYIYKVLAGILFAVLWLFSLLPLRIGYVISDGMYLIVYHLIRYRRHVVRNNLTSSFPEKSHAEIIDIDEPQTPATNPQTSPEHSENGSSSSLLTYLLPLAGGSLLLILILLLLLGRRKGNSEEA